MLLFLKGTTAMLIGLLDPLSYLNSQAPLPAHRAYKPSRIKRTANLIHNLHIILFLLSLFGLKIQIEGAELFLKQTPGSRDRHLRLTHIRIISTGFLLMEFQPRHLLVLTMTISQPPIWRLFSHFSVIVIPSTVFVN